MSEPQGQTLLTDLPGDVLARIYLLLGASSASRKAFFSTCKALRADQVTACITSLTLDVSMGDGFERLSTFPQGTTLRHVRLRGTTTICPDTEQEGNLLLILLRGPLSRFQTVTAMTLQDCYLAPENVTLLVHALHTRFPLLTSLTLQQCQGSIDLLLQHMATPPELHHFQQLQSLHIHGLVATSNKALSISTLSCTQPARLVPFKHLRHASLSMPRPLFYTFERGELACLADLPLLESLELGCEASEGQSGLEELLQRSPSLKKLQVHKLPRSVASLRSSTLQRLVLEHLHLHQYADLAAICQQGLLPCCRSVSVLHLHVIGPKDQLPQQMERAAQANETGLASLMDWRSCCLVLQDMVVLRGLLNSSGAHTLSSCRSSNSSSSSSIYSGGDGSAGSPGADLADQFDSLQGLGSAVSQHNNRLNTTTGLQGVAQGQIGVGMGGGAEHCASSVQGMGQQSLPQGQHSVGMGQGAEAGVGGVSGGGTDTCSSRSTGDCAGGISGGSGYVIGGAGSVGGVSGAAGSIKGVGSRGAGSRIGGDAGRSCSRVFGGGAGAIDCSSGSADDCSGGDRAHAPRTARFPSAVCGSRSVFSSGACPKELWRLLDRLMPLGHMHEWRLHRCDLSVGSLAAGLAVCKTHALVLEDCSLATMSLAEAAKAMPHLQTIHIIRCQGLLTSSLTLLAAHAQHRCEPLTVVLKILSSERRFGTRAEPYPLTESFVREFGSVVSSLKGLNITCPHDVIKLYVEK